MDLKALLFYMFAVAMVTCKEPCHIRKSYQPICGTDGRTYTNQDALRCRKIKSKLPVKIAYEGTCRREDEPRCQYSRRPQRVCGSDGLTYLNAAMVACKNILYPSKQITITRKGPCGISSSS